MSKEDNYKNKTIEKAEDVLYALKYYANRCELLEKENKRLQEMYENRVNEYIKITDRVGGKTIE